MENAGLISAALTRHMDARMRLWNGEIKSTGPIYQARQRPSEVRAGRGKTNRTAFSSPLLSLLRCVEACLLHLT